MIPETPRFPAPRGPRAPHLPLVLLLLLLPVAQGLRVIPAPDSCSQPGLRCSVVTSNCFDLSWLHTYNWTPSAPSHLGVTAGSKLNEMGQRVAVLQISWKVSADASIKLLQGAEISVLELSTNHPQCVQLRFGNEFPAQRDENGQPWRFYYDDFQVVPGNEYTVTLQHLPKNDDENGRTQRIAVPDCTNSDMMLTNHCCDQGYCWRPNISLEVVADALIVTFTPRSNDEDYNILVRLQKDPIHFLKEPRRAGAPSDRLRVTIPSARTYDACLYSVEVWPDIEDCYDCVRKRYGPTKCSDPVTAEAASPGRVYLWAIAAAATFLVFSAIVLVLYYFHDCLYTPGKKSAIAPAGPLPPPRPTKRKVWLVYSADHRRYVYAVIKLADYLRVTWGMDVILDRLHVQEIGVMGAMAWLDRQKEDIETSNGTILILCSQGAQEKWKAMKDRQEPRVTLRSDAQFAFGDLFTPALTLILPDFQKAKPYDRYVVAYFSKLCDLELVPSPLKICPIHPLVENLQSLFFRIQRFEQYQPNVQLTVGDTRGAAYQQLLKAIDRCLLWQEKHQDWFHGECSPDLQEESESSDEEDGTVGSAAAHRVNPLIRRPETSVSEMNPILSIPDAVLSIEPTIMVAPPADLVDPLLYETDPTTTVLQPLLRESTEVLILDPSLEDVTSLPELHQPLLDQDVSNQPKQDLPPMEVMNEAHKQLFYHSVLQEQETETSHVDLVVALPQSSPLQGQCVTRNMPMAAGTDKPQPPQSDDQGYYTWNADREDLQALRESSVLLLLRNGGLLDYS